jgi:hypothetical protein
VRPLPRCRPETESGRGLGDIIRDEAIVAALAAGLSNREAAKRAGVDEKTVRNRLKEPAFLDWLEEAKQNPQDLACVYTALDKATEAWQLIAGLDEGDFTDVTAHEAKKFAALTVKWLDEWAYTLEEECAG